ncbi:MAG: hypothetical protein SPI12_04350 [Actinomycetaceae bacterium]|nr:hypothetical protein [Actinomycetaceae bacterium]MDY6083075.1 hypothetical protein [Actinomycetaceae bacterium]
MARKRHKMSHRHVNAEFDGIMENIAELDTAPELGSTTGRQHGPRDWAPPADEELDEGELSSVDEDAVHAFSMPAQQARRSPLVTLLWILAVAAAGAGMIMMFFPHTASRPLRFTLVGIAAILAAFALLFSTPKRGETRGDGAWI